MSNTGWTDKWASSSDESTYSYQTTNSQYGTGSCCSEFSTDTTYGTLGSWTGGDTHASGYEADVESNASSTK